MNVIDEYKGLDVDTIRGLNAASCFPAAVAMHNVYGNLNLGSIIRTANFLGFREVLYFGRRKWDRRGAVGNHNYTQLNYYESEAEFLAAIKSRGYNLIALENNTTCEISQLWDFTWPPNPCILVGEEQNGLPEDILNECFAVVEIPGLGSARCLNVSVAAAIAMSDYASKT